jgi:predicted Holliday junction resolvase-like endonuclease
MTLVIFILFVNVIIIQWRIQQIDRWITDKEKKNQNDRRSQMQQK